MKLGKKVTSKLPRRGVIYVRYSSNNQREESAEAQERACRSWAKENNIIVMKVYKDCAKTGRNTTGRDAFNEMMDDAKNGEIDCIIVHKSDRLSRNRYDAITCKHKLKQYGVELISVLENFGNNPESILLESLMDGLNEYYSRNLSREVMKGMKESAYQCKHLGGVPPLGYDVDTKTKKYVINEEEAFIIRRIYTMYSQGVGYKRVLRYLNDEMQFKTKSGNEFTSSTLNNILKNEKYTGVYIFNRKHEKDCLGNRKPQLNEEKDIIKIEGGMPAIISKELFDMVQDKMKSNKEKVNANSKNESFLLTGRIRCGVCGAPMTGNTKWCNDGKKRYSTYRCSNRAQHKAECQNKEIRKDYVEGYVIRKTIETLLEKENIVRIHHMIEDNIHLEKAKIKEDLKNVCARKTRTEENIKEIQKQGNEEVIKELIERREELEQQSVRLFKMLEVNNISIKQVKNGLKGIQKYITSSDDELCRKLLQQYVEVIYVYEDYVEIKFSMLSEKNEYVFKISI